MNVLDRLDARYNVSPGSHMPVVTKNSPNKAVVMVWGYKPKWMQGSKLLINAQAETLAKKPTFKKALQFQRCIIPASGFYEWKREKEGKQPYWFYVKGQDLFGFAGLWYENTETKEMEYVIITTTPNELMEDVHNRMPVILNKDDEEAWLNPDETEAEKLLPLLRPYPAEKMGREMVSKAVNIATNDSKNLIEPINSK